MNREIFIINTIVSYMIHMFDDNDVVHAVASTGMAAFNVLGGGRGGTTLICGSRLAEHEERNDK
jgi:hypothetical protein